MKTLYIIESRLAGGKSEWRKIPFYTPSTFEDAVFDCCDLAGDIKSFEYRVVPA